MGTFIAHTSDSVKQKSGAYSDTCCSGEFEACDGPAVGSKPVMAGLDPAIHAFDALKRVPENGSFTQSIVIASFTAKTEHVRLIAWSRRAWMAGTSRTSPAMTTWVRGAAAKRPASRCAPRGARSSGSPLARG
jgi:hypothetical protein